MKPWELIRFCPRCGAAANEARAIPFRCASCAFTLFFNPVVGVAGLIRRPDGAILLVRRAKEPAKGKLGVPGGFVDFGETAEDALRREAREEVGLQLDAMEFFLSYPNEYTYRDVTYGVLDLYFTARIGLHQSVAALDEVDSFVWQQPAEIQPDELAFPSLRHALRCYRERTASARPAAGFA